MTNVQSIPVNDADKASPFKKGFSPKRNSSKMNKQVRRLIKVVGFGALAVELYCFIKGSDRDGWNEDYTRAFRQFIDAEFEVPFLADAGFCGYYLVRASQAGISTVRGTDNWSRFYLLRMLPNQVPSTAVTRQEGMDILRAFFMDKTYSLYPPASIVTMDDTQTDQLLSLDHFLIDGDIVSIMQQILDESKLTTDFSLAFPLIAPLIFGGPAYSELAVNQFGYGRTAHAAVAPGFVIPVQNGTNQQAKQAVEDPVPDGGAPKAEEAVKDPVSDGDAPKAEEPVLEPVEENPTEESAEKPESNEGEKEDEESDTEPVDEGGAEEGESSDDEE